MVGCHSRRTKLTSPAAKVKTLKRGVKEVVKSLRKSSIPAAAAEGTPHHVCVLAADISPMDVISHIPVLCEDHGVPYVFVTSRAELGAAGQTKRPTSVVLVGKDVAGKAAEKGAQADGRTLEQVQEEWAENYSDLVKVAKKAGRDVRF
jgi:H/ACA ribonucleoprotein complex subunit 2